MDRAEPEAAPPSPPARPPTQSGARARGVLALVAALLLGYYALTPDGIYGAKAQGDGFFSFHYLPSLAVFHSLDMRHALPLDLERMDTGPRGHKLNRTPIGPALGMLPLYCLGESTKAAVAAGLGALGRDPRVLGPPPFVPHTGQMLYTGLLSAVAAIGGMLVLYRLLRRHTGEGPALLGAAAAVTCTPVFWYATVQPHYQHALAFAATVLLLERWDAGRGSGLVAARFLKLGLLGGLAMLMRAQEAVFLLAPGLELGAALASALRRRDGRLVLRALRAGTALGTGALLGFLPQLAVWAAYFGWFVRPFHIELMRPGEPALLEVLFSMRAGLLPWTPLGYLGLFGLALGLRRRDLPQGLRGLCAAALVIVAADVYLVAASWAWHGTFSFGARRLSDLAGPLGLGTTIVCARVAAAGRGRGPALLRVGVAVALLGCLGLSAGQLELWRRRVLPNSAREARSAASWVEQLGGPRWLVALLRLGNPLVQPAGWAFALAHHAPPAAWESVAGSYVAERNEHDLALEGTGWSFVPPDGNGLKLVASGAEPGPGGDGIVVRGALRLLLQPFAHEPLELRLDGDFPEGELSLRWDGAELSVQRDGDTLRAPVPIERVRAHHVAELELRLPSPGLVRRLQIGATSRWWQARQPR